MVRCFTLFNGGTLKSPSMRTTSASVLTVVSVLTLFSTSWRKHSHPLYSNCVSTDLGAFAESFLNFGCAAAQERF